MLIFRKPVRPVGFAVQVYGPVPETAPVIQLVPPLVVYSQVDTAESASVNCVVIVGAAEVKALLISGEMVTVPAAGGVVSVTTGTGLSVTADHPSYTLAEYVTVSLILAVVLLIPEKEYAEPTATGVTVV